jgi:DNA-directed RNA polymerase subunit RPC12/RpoP
MSDGRLADHPRQTLRCAECGNEAAKDATGWLACLIVGDEDAEDIEEVAIFCPECAAREVGA